MSKNTKLIAALSVIAGLGTAVMPVAGVFADTQPQDVTLNVDVSSDISINIDNASSNTTASMTANDFNNLMSTTVAVSTTNQTGYTLSVKDADADTNLTLSAYNENDENAANMIIEARAGALTAGDQAWNYSVDGGDQNKAITAADVAIRTTASAATGSNANRQTKVTYNVATGENQVSGRYSDTIVYSAVANPGA